MKVMENVHQIRIDFQVTDKVHRFVYVYLITGNYCYLIDSGVAEGVEIIADYMKGIGRSITEVKAVFLTHAHPDHIGGAAAVRRRANCKVYCSEGERDWVWDIDRQFRERPIPNFYRLAGQSVPEAETVCDGDQIKLEDGIELTVIGTAGHSKGDVSYRLNQSVLFTGDAVPAGDDLPIFVSWEESLQSLSTIGACTFTKCCPAWDRVYEKKECEALLQDRKELLYNLRETVMTADRQYAGLPEQDRIAVIAECMGLAGAAENPLFAASVRACRSRESRT